MQLKSLTLSMMLVTGVGQPALAADTAKPATEVTKAANAAVLKELPFNNKQAFEDSKRGFIAPLENKGVVKNAKGDVIWDLPKFDFLLTCFGCNVSRTEMRRQGVEYPRNEQHVPQPRVNGARSWKKMIGYGIPDRAKPKLVAAILLTEQVHQPLRTIALCLVKIDPANC